MGRRKKQIPDPQNPPGPGRPAAENGAPDLTPLELEVMRVLWDRGNATAAEVREAMMPERPLADTTIHTVLARLREKGAIKPVPTVERAFRFAPAVARTQVAGRSLRRVLREFFEGSPRRLMAHLMTEERLDEEEMEELRQLLDSKALGRGAEEEKKNVKAHKVSKSPHGRSNS